MKYYDRMCTACRIQVEHWHHWDGKIYYTKPKNKTWSIIRRLIIVIGLYSLVHAMGGI